MNLSDLSEGSDSPSASAAPSSDEELVSAMQKAVHAFLTFDEEDADHVASARLAAANQQQQEFTTLMLRNLPNSYSCNILLELLDNEGFSGHYDLVYVPVDFSRLAGLGYAFVNWTSNDAAERAWQTFQGFNRWSNTSRKVCEVSWSSPLQGLSAHIEHYRNSPVMHESVPECYKPALFQDGLRLPFPSPTQQIKAPRMKRRAFDTK